jgi:hypothetical protein
MVWTKSETAVSLSGVATVGKVVQLQNHDGDVYVLCELQRGPVKQHMVKIWSTEAFDFAHSKHHGVLPMPDDNDDSLLKEGFVRTTRDIDRAPKLRYLRLFNNVLCEYRYKQVCLLPAREPFHLLIFLPIVCLGYRTMLLIRIREPRELPRSRSACWALRRRGCDFKS